MLGLIDLIPNAWRWVGVAVIAALIAGAGAWGGHELSAAYYKPQLTDAYEDAATQRNKVAAYNVALIAANQSIDAQNAAVQAMRADAAKRAKAGATALATATRAAEARRITITRLRTILSTPLTCEAGVQAAKDAL